MSKLECLMVNGLHIYNAFLWGQLGSGEGVGVINIRPVKPFETVPVIESRTNGIGLKLSLYPHIVALTMGMLHRAGPVWAHSHWAICTVPKVRLPPKV